MSRGQCTVIESYSRLEGHCSRLSASDRLPKTVDKLLSMSRFRVCTEKPHQKNNVRPTMENLAQDGHFWRHAPEASMISQIMYLSLQIAITDPTEQQQKTSVM